MLVIGAKGFAKEILEILRQNNELKNLAFYDDVNENSAHLYGKFPILNSLEKAEIYFKEVDSNFTLGIGNSSIRRELYMKFIGIGGKFTSTISRRAEIGSYGVNIGIGCNILPHSIIANSASIGIGCIVYYNAMITHDCEVGDFVEISPGAAILGNVKIGDYCQVGANVSILPKIKIGKNVVIGAGAVVIEDLPDNCTAVGVPAKIIKRL